MIVYSSDHADKLARMMPLEVLTCHKTRAPQKITSGMKGVGSVYYLAVHSIEAWGQERQELPQERDQPPRFPEILKQKLPASWDESMRTRGAKVVRVLGQGWFQTGMCLGGPRPANEPRAPSAQVTPNSNPTPQRASSTPSSTPPVDRRMRQPRKLIYSHQLPLLYTSRASRANSAIPSLCALPCIASRKRRGFFTADVLTPSPSFNLTSSSPSSHQPTLSEAIARDDSAAADGPAPRSRWRALK